MRLRLFSGTVLVRVCESAVAVPGTSVLPVPVRCEYGTVRVPAASAAYSTSTSWYEHDSFVVVSRDIFVYIVFLYSTFRISPMS